MNGFSVIMPTYNQASFIKRAIMSLFRQTHTEWELIIINDGCTDSTEAILSNFLPDKRIKVIKNKINCGLGRALNQGLEQARFDVIAYLPSDDFYYNDHLKSIKEIFDQSTDIILVFSGIRYDNKDSLVFSTQQKTTSIRSGYSLQLVQTAHQKTKDRWVERNEWVSEDLYKLFWRKLTDKGAFCPTKKITCNWTNHQLQHHKIASEKYGGGLNFYRTHYRVQNPIKMKVSDLKFIDEEKLYDNFRKKSSPIENSLKILLVGELAYNPERIYALEQQGHQLYGLWIQRPTFSFSTVGHLPFGNVEDISYENWKEKVREIKPDIIYALLNFGAIPLAHEVMKSVPEIPFVWHFKEGPFVCMQNGTWNELIELYKLADGKIYLSPEVKQWYEQFIPNCGLSYILDGDIPKADYFTNNFSPRLSESDGAIHTVIAGRMIGIEPEDMKVLANQDIHIHVYTENYHELRVGSDHVLKTVAPNHYHVHPHCSHLHWVKEFSQYDAGWLHCFRSDNKGDLMKATWDDLNIPARINTLAAAGLPMIQRDNSESIVAMQARVRQLNTGVCFQQFENLGESLKNKDLTDMLRTNILNNRKKFSFDYHVPGLIDFFREVIQKKKSKHSK